MAPATTPSGAGLTAILTLAAEASAWLTSCGIVSVLAGVVAVRRFAGNRPLSPKARPAISVLKPLCGDEPLLEAALASICGQAYPAFQIVFGVQDANDSALAVVRRMQRRFPGRDITVVIDAALHGPNRKIGNLINMMPAARHDVLVFSDSDLHVPPDYLDRIAAALEAPGIGLVTTLCTGLPTSTGIAARLGATGISHLFLPGALLARALGREDCLGTTMALRRDTLVRAGGLSTLVRHLADDNVLAHRVRQLGLGVGLARTVPMTAVPEASLAALWQHELRWARTIRVLEPALFALSMLQFPLFWAAITFLLADGSAGSTELFATVWAIRAGAVLWIDRMLRARVAAPIWLLPVRDILSASQIIGSYLGARVVWRGHVMRADDGRVKQAWGAAPNPAHLQALG